MGPSLANPFPSIVQILNHEVPLLERQHATMPLELPKIVQQGNAKKRLACYKRNLIYLLYHINSVKTTNM